MSKKISSKDLRALVLETRDKSMAKTITNGELRNMIIEAMNNPDDDSDVPPGHHKMPDGSVMSDDDPRTATGHHKMPDGSIMADDDPRMKDDHDEGEGRKLGNGGKSRMARQHLYKIAEYGVELWNLLDDEDEIPEWCQSKIAIISDSIGKIKHHLEYKIEKPKIKELELDND